MPRNEPTLLHSGLAVSLTFDGRLLTIGLSGELDIEGVPLVAAYADHALAVRPRPRAVTIETGQLTFIDLVGLRALMDACQQLQQRAPLQICGANRHLQRILDLSGLRLGGLAHDVTTPVATTVGRPVGRPVAPTLQDVPSGAWASSGA